MGQHAMWGLVITTAVATFVEMVEALTIVLAMGLTRGWRSVLYGVVAAILALCAFTVAVGYSLTTWLPRPILQLTVGTLLLIFGLQWLRKAILRAAGMKESGDEEERFRQQAAAGRSAVHERRLGLDWFAFVVSFKGVFLEGVEVVFLVITFGLSANNVPLAAVTALVSAMVVGVLGLVATRPLSAVPENALKFVVGLLLATFGTYWAVEGLGGLRGGESLSWPGGDVAPLIILAGWALLSWALVAVVPRVATSTPAAVVGAPDVGAAPTGRAQP